MVNSWFVKGYTGQYGSIRNLNDPYNPERPATDDVTVLFFQMFLPK